MTQAERQSQSRRKILEAAMDEFGARDFDAVTMEAICAGHGISKGMMYHYYTGKDELFLACFSIFAEACPARCSCIGKTGCL